MVFKAESWRQEEAQDDAGVSDEEWRWERSRCVTRASYYHTESRGMALL